MTLSQKKCTRFCTRCSVSHMAATRFKFSTDVNPDTWLLAEHLRAAFQEAMDADVGIAIDLESRATLAWYRVAERAKELRA